DGGTGDAARSAEAGRLRFKDVEREADADGDRSAPRGSPVSPRSREPGVGVRGARAEPEGERLCTEPRRVAGRDLRPHAPATRDQSVGARVAFLEIGLPSGAARDGESFPAWSRTAF